jgi:hypothetical protein
MDGFGSKNGQLKTGENLNNRLSHLSSLRAGKVKASDKKFFAFMFSIKRKKFLSEPEGLGLDCGW